MAKFWMRPNRNAPLMRGRLTLDIDENAERFVVMERDTGRVFTHQSRPSSGTFTAYYRTKLTLNNNVVVLIFDDSREFSAVVLDGIKLDIVNVNEDFQG